MLSSNSHEPWLRALIATAYSFGFRVNELLPLRVRQVNLSARTITLDPGTTKNRRAREVGLTEEVYKLIYAGVFGKTGENFVFTRDDGAPIKDFRWPWWASMCALA